MNAPPAASFSGYPLSLGWQAAVLFILALPVACIVRTFIYEEIFRELRDFCLDHSKSCRTVARRKFFYLFTCEYCFSHWTTLVALLLTRFHLLLPDWRGYVLAFFALPFIANIYLNLYSRLRLEIHKERSVIESIEKNGSAKQPADKTALDDATNQRAA